MKKHGEWRNKKVDEGLVDCRSKLFKIQSSKSVLFFFLLIFQRMGKYDGNTIWPLVQKTIFMLKASIIIQKFHHSLRSWAFSAKLTKLRM